MSINIGGLSVLRAYIGNIASTVMLNSSKLVDGVLTILSISGDGTIYDEAGGTLVNGRTSTATVEDWEGNILDCKVGEIRYDKGRRVENISAGYHPYSVNSGSFVDNGDGTFDIFPQEGSNNSGVKFDYGIEDTKVLKVGRFVYSYKVTSIAGYDLPAKLYSLNTGNTVNTNVPSVITNPSSETKVTCSINITDISSATVTRLEMFDNTVALANVGFRISEIQIEDVSNQSNQNPSEYIDSSTIYNAGIPGVKYFDYQNSNTVGGNGVVTEAVGDTLPDMKMLHEGAGTNLLYPSNDLTAYASNNVTIGTSNIVEDSSLTTHRIWKSIQYPVGSYNFSVRVIPSGRTWIALEDASQGFGRRTFFNCNGVGSIGVSDAAITPSITLMADGSYLCSISISDSLSTTANVFIYLCNNDNSRTYQGDGVSGAIIYNTNSIDKFYVESHIPTTTAPVTRAADSFNIPLSIGSNFHQDNGILRFKWKVGYDESDVPINTYGDCSLFSIASSAGNLLYGQHDATLYKLVSTDGSVYSTNTITFTKGDTILVSVCWNAAESLFSINHSLDEGVTWSTWVRVTYDGNFTAGALINLFYNNLYSNELDFANVYKVPASLTMDDMEAWSEVQ